MLGKRLKLLRELKQKSQQEVCSALNIEQSTLANYENGKRMPKIDILIKIAEYYQCTLDYLLGRTDEDAPGITDILSYPDSDENAISFPQKLALQIEYNGSSIKEVADRVGVSQEKLLSWLTGESSDYELYYKKLSDYFDVEEFYWTTPRAISPGIVPNTNEYILILLLREYQRTGKLDSKMYGDLEEYFPGVLVASKPTESKLLNAFRNLTDVNKDIIIGEIQKLLKEQRRDSVAEENLRLNNPPKKSFPSSGTEGIA